MECTVAVGGAVAAVGLHVGVSGSLRWDILVGIAPFFKSNCLLYPILHCWYPSKSSGVTKCAPPIPLVEVAWVQCALPCRTKRSHFCRYVRGASYCRSSWNCCSFPQHIVSPILQPSNRISYYNGENQQQRFEYSDGPRKMNKRCAGGPLPLQADQGRQSTGDVTNLACAAFPVNRVFFSDWSFDGPRFEINSTNVLAKTTHYTYMVM